MRRLLPAPAGEVDPARELGAPARVPPSGRPWIMLNMIASADGAAVVDGLSGDLGGEADREVFLALRGLPDMIMAASGTVRAEDYGPSRPTEAVRAERADRGQAPVPPIAVVSRSLDFDWEHRFFAEAEASPLILTTEDADRERVARARETAEVLQAGRGSVDLPAAMGVLAERGVGLVLVEGGPALNGQLLRDGLVDELHLTVAPSLVGGDAIRIVRGEPPAAPYGLALEGVLEAEGTLFLRYLRA